MEFYRKGDFNNPQPFHGISRYYRAVDPTDNTVHATASISGVTSRTEHFNYNNPELSRYKNDEQLPLFETQHAPGWAKVNYLSSSLRGRTHAMRLLALAQNDLDRSTNPGERISLEPSYDLSKHSLKLARNLQDRGIVSKDVPLPEHPTNSIDFWENESPYDDASYGIGFHDPNNFFEEWDKISQEEVAAGKQTMRVLLNRHPRKAPLLNTEQFTQGTLF